MTKEELIQFLRDNLRVNVSCQIETEYWSADRNVVRVQILLGDEVICEDSDCHLFYINHETNTYFAR